MLKSSVFWFALTAIALLLVGLWLTWWQWDWLRSGSSETASNGDTLRNAGLMLGGVLALIFALWRGWVAEQQKVTAQRQADIALQSSLNEQYEQGAEMLGSDVLSVRLGGIYALRRLAEEHPGQYHIQSMELLCAFVRNPKEDNGVHIQKGLREDVQAVIAVIGRRRNAGMAIESEADFTLDLHDAHLSYAHLSGLNLARADLSNAKLDHASFFDMPFKQPDLSDPIPSGPNQPPGRISLDMDPVGPDLAGLEGRLADLSLATLRGADLSDSRLLGTDLSGADLLDANLSNCEIIYSNLRMAVLLGASLAGAFILDSDLTGVKLAHANLTDTRFPSTKLYGANLFMASLKGADFSDSVLSWENSKYVVTGLTQEQLDEARGDPSKPPDLIGLVDYINNEPLVWRGKPLAEQG